MCRMWLFGLFCKYSTVLSVCRSFVLVSHLKLLLHKKQLKVQVRTVRLSTVSLLRDVLYRHDSFVSGR